MIASLAAAIFFLRLTTASLITSNTTKSGITILPLVPVTAFTAPYLEIPTARIDILSTYVSADTSSSIPDYGIPAGSSSTSTPTPGTNNSGRPSESLIALTSYPTVVKPTYTNTETSLRIVHTERTQDSLSIPPPHSTFTPPPASPIALTKLPTVAHPTLPESVTSLDNQPTETYVPAIVHIEKSAGSLDVPHQVPTQSTGPTSGGGEGESHSVPHEETISVPTTVVTMAPDKTVSMGGYQSTLTLTESWESAPTMLGTTISEQAMTMSGGQVVTVPSTVYTLPIIPVSSSSSTATHTLSNDEPSAEGTASMAHTGSWVFPLLGMVVGVVLLM